MKNEFRYLKPFLLILLVQIQDCQVYQLIVIGCYRPQFFSTHIYWFYILTLHVFLL